MEQAQPVDPYAWPNRMEVHVKVITVVNIVLACIGFLAAIVLFFVFGVASAVTGGTGAPRWLPGFLAGLGLFLMIIPVAYGILALMAAMKLNQRKQVGKTLAIITSILSLFTFPIGTAYGIYALWALFQRETDQLLHA